MDYETSLMIPTVQAELRAETNEVVLLYEGFIGDIPMQQEIRLKYIETESVPGGYRHTFHTEPFTTFTTDWETALMPKSGEMYAVLTTGGTFVDASRAIADRFCRKFQENTFSHILASDGNTNKVCVVSLMRSAVTG